ncbi:Flavodoxin [Streptococcus sp. ZB199]|nr:Flavodoxin [Streptococcus sp. ZB199]
MIRANFLKRVPSFSLSGKVSCKMLEKWYNTRNSFWEEIMTVAKIVFASMTGNTEEIADIVADKFRDLGVEVDVDECTTVDAEDFLDADIAVVATYTYGDGELPDEIQDFYEDLAGLDLKGKLYGVVGSGDTFYDEFCKAVDDFDRCFAATGAEKGSECVKVDLSAEDEDIEKLEAFAEELVAKAN